MEKMKHGILLITIFQAHDKRKELTLLRRFNKKILKQKNPSRIMLNSLDRYAIRIGKYFEVVNLKELQ